MVYMVGEGEGTGRVEMVGEGKVQKGVDCEVQSPAPGVACLLTFPVH